MTTSTLVLYDTTGQWGWLGELYAIMSANLASHFGSWTAMPVASYQTGQLKQYTAAIYIGSTYDEPLPTAFLDDVYGTTSAPTTADLNGFLKAAGVRASLWEFPAKGETTKLTQLSALDWKN